MQKFYFGDGNSDVLKNILDGTGAVRYMLIHSPSLKYFNLGTYIKSEKRIACSFGDIEPNPDYATVCRATELFNGNECDGIIAIGGGSVIDVAKTVKMFCNMPQGSNYIEEAAMPADIPLLAIPTTAGTGSESTCFAAIYINSVYVLALESQGRIKRTNLGNIDTPQRLNKGEVTVAPLVGQIACGQPNFAEENIEESFSLPQGIFGHGKLFMLRAFGNSMIDAGISAGDLLVLRQQDYADEGEIVVALVGEDATLKRF